MRQDHKAGDKVFVDYSGDGIPYIDPHTGEIREAKLFVAVLGASNYIFAEATLEEDLRSWIEAHVHAYEYFGGVPAATVPDNTKTGVTSPCYYEPDLNPTYHEMAKHYGTAILPARIRKPKDKAKVENAVLIVQRWILAALRNCTFYSIEQVNEAVEEKLEEINNRPFQKLDGTRKELFEELDKPALMPLPSRRYYYARWSKARVNIDYHVEVDKHFYSVPYKFARKMVEVRLTTNTVEFFLKGNRIASHRRSFYRHSHSTITEHMPKSHQRYLEWTPSRIINWASKNGPSTARLVEQILAARPHPEQGFRSCLGILRLGKKYDGKRLEAACNRALAIKSYSYKSVKSILATGLDKTPIEPGLKVKPSAPIQHENIRGSDYYR